ncbi:MAG: hypothetical protein WC455_13295 [Dehalococcoidia bacterium]|jgi:hypothetical protein
MVNRLEVGMVVKTNYGTGPYQIVDIIRKCDCPHPVEEINNPSGARRSKRHIHLTCRHTNNPNKRDYSYLNGFDEKTLKSVWNKDRLIICDDIMPSEPIQTSMDMEFKGKDDNLCQLGSIDM